VLWFTGSSCTYGKLTTPSSWSIDQDKLLWATVMTAKVSHIPVYVEYTVDSSDSCVLVSFALDAQ
jgi:hypothetical protein